MMQFHNITNKVNIAILAVQHDCCVHVWTEECACKQSCASCCCILKNAYVSKTEL